MLKANMSNYLEEHFKVTPKEQRYFLLIVGCILIVPAILTNPFFSFIDFSNNSGEIGDTIGGITAPFLSIVGSGLLYLALRLQLDANNSQRDDISIERFESKFYKLLEFHKEYSTNLKIGANEGKRAFTAMYNEFKFLKLVVKDFYKKSNKTDQEIFNISYLLFFFGTGPNHRDMVKDLITDYDKDLINEIQKHKDKTILKGNRKKRLQIKIGEYIRRKPTYTYFEGHVMRLSHYYRNLYRIVQMVDEAICFKQNEYEQKYHYISILRAQLSVYEQALLYFNASSVLGKDWNLWNIDRDESLIVKYCLIKSLPIPLSKIYHKNILTLGDKDNENSERVNKAGRILFEWQMIMNRNIK